MNQVLDMPAEALAGPQSATDTPRRGAKSVDILAAAVRHSLRALASEAVPQVGLRWVKLLRPLVAQAHEVLRERLETGGSVDEYLRGRARLADSAVLGLLHLAAMATEVRGDSMVAPFAAVAVGGYGRRELAPGSDLDLLFLLPEGSHTRRDAAAIAASIDMVVSGLWDLGFVLDHAARSPRECVALAHGQPSVLAGLLNRRFLWGGFGLFAVLDADLGGLFSGPDAARWRGAVVSAMVSARRHALHGVGTRDDEPDVKRGPGGLRDLQLALSANTLASARPVALAEPALVEAHRFLWLVRCHLHFLSGRAEDRLSAALRPGVARRIGLDLPARAADAPFLMRLFRQHTQNVFRAAELATASLSAQHQ
jgi:[protein-PII] uridylyltransferase